MTVDPQLLVATCVSLLAIAVAALLLRRAQKQNPTSAPVGPALDPATFQPFRLKEKITISHDTRIFRFELKPNQPLGLPIGKHIALRAIIDGAPVQRSYTPISSDEDKGYFDLLVKVYFANVHPAFPSGGRLTQYLERLSIGDTVDVRGPHGRFEYLGKGRYVITGPNNVTVKEGTARWLSMCAGGTGITPLLQIIRAVLRDPNDTTSMALLFANQTEDDILLRSELDKLAADPRLKVWYTLDRPPEGWTYSTGFINQRMVKQQLFQASEDTLALMCGPPPMIERACKPNLIAEGYAPESLFAF